MMATLLLEALDIMPIVHEHVNITYGVGIP